MSDRSSWAVDFRRLLCRHIWVERLIFSVGRHTHHEHKSCIKCGKIKAIFSGTRSSWYRHHSLADKSPGQGAMK